MKKIVLNSENIVENIINANDDFSLLNKTLMNYQDGVCIGDIYNNGVFEKNLAKIESERIKALKIEANKRLEKTDSVAIRCLKAGIDFPSEWVEYTDNLRLIINGQLSEMPETPDYPAGS